MSFNKNACKRLSIVAGIERESKDVMVYVNILTSEYLETLLYRITQIISLSSKKTINVNDIKFLSVICQEYPQVACPESFTKLVQVYIDSDLVREGGSFALYTLKKPFETFVRDVLARLNPDLRFGKNSLLLIQYLTEQYIISLMRNANVFMKLDNRDTLFAKDLEALKKVCR